MRVVCNTSPLTNLAKIQRLDILESLYGRVFIPTAVANELSALPQQAALLAASPWIEILPATDLKRLAELLQGLDPGEAEAIALAAQVQADLIILDERAARLAAHQLQLRTMGLCGVLIAAKNALIIPTVWPVLYELRVNAKFWLSDDVVKLVLEATGEHEEKPE
ncbi:MAG: DUF3368 domain-containing protein [Candidatus Sumerlaeaceae bacterium]